MWCKQCKRHEVIETPQAHYCSPECARDALLKYWKDKYLHRKKDPVAREHVRKAKRKYYWKKKGLTEDDFIEYERSRVEREIQRQDEKHK